MRQVACQWVVENMEGFKPMVSVESFPRLIHDNDSVLSGTLYFTAVGLACVAMVLNMLLTLKENFTSSLWTVYRSVTRVDLLL